VPRELSDVPAVVVGGGSGLGAATAAALAAAGARVAVVDLDAEAAARVAAELPGAVAYGADVTDADALAAAFAAAAEAQGSPRIGVVTSGVAWAQRTVTRDGPAPLDFFARVVNVNLVGSYNALRLLGAAMGGNAPDASGERGVVVLTASVAAYDGQVGQVAYAASKGGVASMTLPAARDLARSGVRVVTIAPGLFDTPMLALLPEEKRAALAADVPFPARLGSPAEYADLALALVRNPYVNGEVVRLDAAVRLPFG
jgi:NAD(P)-dependent dehydrogenase (short-subunit alcohol dehydrogenase family)